MTARKPRAPSESHGRTLLGAITASNAEVARTLGSVGESLVTREHVRQWRVGLGRPRPPARRALARFYGIPASSWDTAPTGPSAAPTSPRAPARALPPAVVDHVDDDEPEPADEPEVARAARALPEDAPLEQLRELLADLRAARRRPGVLGAELATIARAEGALLERRARLDAAEQHDDRDEELQRAQREAAAWPLAYRAVWSLLVATSPTVSNVVRDSLNGTLPVVLGSLYSVPAADAPAARTLRDLIAAFDAVPVGSDAEQEHVEALARWLGERRRAWIERIGGAHA